MLASTADEPPEWNFVKKHSDALIAQGIDPLLARARCFGMGEDAFMGQVGMMLDTGRFENYKDIGAAWMSDNCNAYIPEYQAIKIVPAPDVQRYLVNTVEVIQQPLVQMAAGGPVKEDMFASFTSAFGAAKRLMGSEDTMIVVSDLTKRQPSVRNFRNVVVNGVLTRFHSKAWRDRMLEHGYSGVLEFGDIFKAMRCQSSSVTSTVRFQSSGEIVLPSAVSVRAKRSRSSASPDSKRAFPTVSPAGCGCGSPSRGRSLSSRSCSCSMSRWRPSMS